MSRAPLRIAALMGLLAGLLVAAPVSAAETGTICGTVTEFQAPNATLSRDGSLTLDDVTEVIDADASVAGNASAALAAAAAADASVCIDVVADPNGVVTSVSLSTSFCGDVSVDATAGATSVNGVVIPASSLSGDAAASAALSAVASAGGEACVDVTYNTAGAITDASVRATIDDCGEVVLEADGDAVVGGTAFDGSLIDAEMRSTLEAIAASNSSACVRLQAVSQNGATSTSMTVTATICLTVTAVSGNQVTLGDLPVTVDNETARTVEVGPASCLPIADGPDAGVLGGALAEEFASLAGLAGALPDTAMAAPRGVSAAAILGVLLVAGALGVAALRVVRRSAR